MNYFTCGACGTPHSGMCPTCVIKREHEKNRLQAERLESERRRHAEGLELERQRHADQIERGRQSQLQNDTIGTWQQRDSGNNQQNSANAYYHSNNTKQSHMSKEEMRNFLVSQGVSKSFIDREINDIYNAYLTIDLSSDYSKSNFYSKFYSNKSMAWKIKNFLYHYDLKLLIFMLSFIFIMFAFYYYPVLVSNIEKFNTKNNSIFIKAIVFYYEYTFLLIYKLNIFLLGFSNKILSFFIANSMFLSILNFSIIFSLNFIAIKVFMFRFIGSLMLLWATYLPALLLILWSYGISLGILK